MQRTPEKNTLCCRAADARASDRAIRVTGVKVGAGLTSHAEWVGGTGDGDQAGHLGHVDRDVECGPSARLSKVDDAGSSGADDRFGGGDDHVEGIAAEAAGGADAEALWIAFPS